MANTKWRPSRAGPTDLVSPAGASANNLDKSRQLTREKSAQHECTSKQNFRWPALRDFYKSCPFIEGPKLIVRVQVGWGRRSGEGEGGSGRGGGGKERERTATAKTRETKRALPQNPRRHEDRPKVGPSGPGPAEVSALNKPVARGKTARAHKDSTLKHGKKAVRRDGGEDRT